MWMPDHEDRAILLRQHLQAAQVTRSELFASDRYRKHITFHDLRATGITWCAVRGDDPLRIKQRAGHRAFSTTEAYIREAENLREGFGVPFPPLPSDLTDSAALPVSEAEGFLAPFLAFRRPALTAKPNFPGSEWSNGGSNPGPPHCERGALPAELLPRMRSLGFAWPSGPIGSATAAEHTPGPIEVKHAYGRLPTLFQRYPDTSERARSPHPFVATNSSSLNGRLTCVGLIICMPSASNMFDTTRSMTRNGK
jgi:hypothetical protein